MKTLQVLEPEKLTPEEMKALRSVGFAVQMTGPEHDAILRAAMDAGYITDRESWIKARVAATRF